MLVDDFCTSCKNRVLDFPRLRCPWCGDGKLPKEVTGAEDPVGALDDLRTRIAALRDERIRLMPERGHYARMILADPELLAAARKRKIRLAWLERWATPPHEAACWNGHKRAEFSTVDNHRNWFCHECKRLGFTQKSPAEQRHLKRRQTIRDRWATHNARQARHEELAAKGEIPPNLKAPLPPPRRVVG